MGIPGFPSENEVLSMFGYVSDEDREKWRRKREAADKDLQNARNGQTAKGFASQFAAPAISMAEKSINAQMQGEQVAARDAMRKRRTERVTERTRYYEEEIPQESRDSGMEF